MPVEKREIDMISILSIWTSNLGMHPCAVWSTQVVWKFPVREWV